MPKSTTAFGRANAVYDTTIGWRFVNPQMEHDYGTDSMPETADNVAQDWGVARADQDAFAFASQQKWQAAQDAGRFDTQIVSVRISQRKSDPLIFDRDEHPRPDTPLEKLAALPGVNGAEKTVTAGNASGVNDGAAALLIASATAASRLGLTPMARIVAMASAGVAPRVMGIGPVPAVQKVLKRAGLTIDDMDIIELNEAFASQGLASLRDLGVADDDTRVNPNGGAIAMGHPIGMTGARIVLAAAHELQHTQKRFALCTMCVGVGQGTAMILERSA
jgi:acetyl-CoA acetyltransferase family protein